MASLILTSKCLLAMKHSSLQLLKITIIQNGNTQSNLMLLKNHQSVEVYDEDFGNDDLLGSTEISLDEVCDNSKQTSWITFKGGKSGSILYNSKFIPTDMIGTILDVSEIRPSATVQDISMKKETVVMEEKTSMNKIIIDESSETNYEKDIEEKVKILLHNDRNTQRKC